ncbi:LutC/YkgG family protein [Rhodococcus rhodnii]|uniref:LutC/YkgG family protein n=1 Tax=Rhodococcus rhodnii TaxID=38312 RepID=UPI000B07FBEF|nr:lactate utilization protein C [Rhodococcus rhodnii]
MSSREEMLARIAAANTGAETVVVPRDYDRAPLTGAPDVDGFAEAVEDYRARVHRVDADAVAATVAELAGPGARVVVPAGLAPAWWADLADLVIDGDPHTLTALELDEIDCVVTGARLGIARTGTIVLDAGPDQGRRAITLVPDHHVCIVRADQIVDTVPQAFAILTADRPLTFVSGPSATSDIELDRVEGVHGPRTLDVVLVR